MGLLDDAIREHLDLKRRRGADPTEVEREEREVLGPVHRRGEELAANEPEFEELHPDEYEPAPLAHDDDVSWASGGSVGESEPPPAPAAFDRDRIVEPELEPLYPVAREPEPAPAEPRPPPAQHPEPALAPPYPAAYDREPEPRPHELEAPGLYQAPHEPEPYRGAGHEHPDDEQSTVEYSLEDAEDAEAHPRPEGEKEDVLEETPEFLQDTPDHDRLWFEQRPPRDFDFDG